MKRYASKKGWRKIYVSGLKSVIVVELAMLGGAYYFWNNLYHNQDYRHTWYKNHPRLLACYYWSMKPVGSIQQKKEDYVAWGVSES